MTQEKRIVKMVISIDVETTKSVDEVKIALERGIYRGLDTEPNYVAPPKDVKINYYQKRWFIMAHNVFQIGEVKFKTKKYVDTKDFKRTD